MSLVKTGNPVHDMNVLISEGVRHAAYAAAGSNQAAVRAADIAHYQTCLASAIANKCSTDVFKTALRELGSN